MERCAYDIAAVERSPHAPVRWPTSVADTQQLNAAIIPAVVAASRAVDDDDDCQAIWAIAAPMIDVTILTICTAWLTWVRAGRRGITFAFENPGLVRTLCEGGEMDGAIFFRQVSARIARTVTKQKHSWLRGAAHGLITNRRPVLPWERPIGVFNHNRLLQGMARQSGSGSFAYLMADSLFAHERTRTSDSAPLPPAQRNRLEQAVVGLLDHILPTLSALAQQPAITVRECLRQAILDYLTQVAAYDSALRQHWRRVPKELWTGTGGNILTRLARSAVRREGGRVIGFEHGGGGHIHADLGPLHIHEFALCDRFVVDTPAKADIFRSGLAAEKSLDGTLPEIVATAAPVASFPYRPGVGATPPQTLMYVTTAFVGETQYPLQPLIPDPVYIDWQARLIDGLIAQGFHVLVKQHPEGLRKGQPLKRSQGGEFLGGRFGDVMDQADAFVFDYPATSTLWEAICSDKPVAFVDHHLAEWNPQVWADFTARCAVVPSTLDADNRPQVDCAALAAALRHAPNDGGAFAHKHLIGGPR
jgi:hypothetical protein